VQRVLNGIGHKNDINGSADLTVSTGTWRSSGEPVGHVTTAAQAVPLRLISLHKQWPDGAAHQYWNSYSLTRVSDTSAVSWVQLGRAPFRQARTTANVATDATTAAVASMPAVRADGRVVIASTVRCQADGCGSSVIAVYRFLQHRRKIAVVCIARVGSPTACPLVDYSSRQHKQWHI
jgi:hypothetical protein